MVNAQEWLDNNYPKGGVCKVKNESQEVNNFKKKRDEIKRLVIAHKKLEGDLKLEGFSDLQRLECNNNQLTNLDLSHCSELEGLSCYNNNLTEVKFLFTLSKPLKLTYLSISNNNFSAQDLSFLVRFTNLEKLFLGSNYFYGSLEN